MPLLFAGDANVFASLYVYMHDLTIFIFIYKVAELLFTS